ncbi:MAG: type II toxin-antitoxin system RelB/DinJ family antitoxin [Geminicoccaceae bacterium]
MTTNTVVRARIDPEIKDEAAAILAATGLTVSDAFRMMLVRTVPPKGGFLRPARPERRDDRSHASRPEG